jgi:hypothetical protein
MAAMSFVAATRHRPGTETEWSGIGLMRLAEHRTVSCGRLRPHGTRCRTVPKGSSLRIRMRIGLDVRGCGVGPSRLNTHARFARGGHRPPSSATLIDAPEEAAHEDQQRDPRQVLSPRPARSGSSALATAVCTRPSTRTPAGSTRSALHISVRCPSTRSRAWRQVRASTSAMVVRQTRVGQGLQVTH